MADQIFRTESYKLQMAGFLKRAHLRGYNTELFFLAEKGSSCQNLDRILYARGYSGVFSRKRLSTDLPQPPTKLSFLWNQ